jgi:recombinational DNA repair ATPase RecF
VKIRSLVIENVACYRERTAFVFDDAMNILIGPNDGGKTNLQRIVASPLASSSFTSINFYATTVMYASNDMTLGTKIKGTPNI